MATSNFLIITALYLVAASQQTVDPVIIPTDETCPSQEDRKSTLLNIENDVWITVINSTPIPECGDGLWKRVAYLNMSDPSQQCPSAWRLYSIKRFRLCGRPANSTQSCPAVVYPTGHQYQRVCGRIIGYQGGSPGAFDAGFADQQPPSLDDPYVDGVSITHGYPRSHIWTFAAGETEGNYSRDPGTDCPCSRSGAKQAPDYIEDNYYCESGNSNNIIGNRFYGGDPLWDGQECEGQCCSNGKSPPWFTVQLSNTTLDDIEVRICGDERTRNEDTPVELIEIYIS